MARGGARPGAGRKKGVANKATREAMDRAASSGELPLDYMLRVMRDVNEKPSMRSAMAVAAAPYVHHKLASIEHVGNKDKPIVVEIVRFTPGPSSS